MSKSIMVIASRYRLLETINSKQGIFNEKGSKKLVREEIQLRRSWVEERNAQKNNELYVIDEEKSAELATKRDENIKRIAADKQLKNVSPAQMLGAVAEGLKNIGNNQGSNTPAPEKLVKEKEVKEKEVEALRAKCDELGIEYSKMAGIKKLTELLEAKSKEE